MPTPTPAPAPASILVIDDNMDTADSLARFLRVGVGHTVRVAYDGPSGVRLAGETGPDVVVCDIAMPKLSGLGVAAALGNMDPRPLLIAVTAFATEFPEAMAKAAGFDFFLAKPADPFVIESLIRDRGRAPDEATGDVAGG
jgi:CheY-like chemotaxis protein